MTAHNYWTGHEIRALFVAFPTKSPTDLKSLFPRHSIRAIYSKAQTLGIKRYRGRVRWAKIAADHRPTIRL